MVRHNLSCLPLQLPETRRTDPAGLIRPGSGGAPRRRQRAGRSAFPAYNHRPAIALAGAVVKRLHPSYPEIIPDLNSEKRHIMRFRFTRPTPEECSPYYFSYIQLVPDGDIVHTLENQHTDIHDLLKRTSETQASARPAPSEWSIKEVVAHLSDAERLFSFRALWFARGEESPLPGMEPNPWVAITDSNARALRDLLTDFDYVRAASLALFANLDEAAWERQGTASGKIMSVRALAWIVAGHERHHNRSLREVYL